MLQSETRSYEVAQLCSSVKLRMMEHEGVSGNLEKASFVFGVYSARLSCIWKSSHGRCQCHLVGRANSLAGDRDDVHVASTSGSGGHSRVISEKEGHSIDAVSPLF